MAIGNRKNPGRHPTDLYTTDPAWTRVLLRRIQLSGPVWEPAAGNGDMTRVLEQSGYNVRATDILTGQDFLQETESWSGSVVTNPPYSLAEEFVHKALSLASEYVAMLLPISFLGGKRRHKSLWINAPPGLVLMVSDRMSVNGQASQFNHMWVVWSRTDTRVTSLEWAIAKEPRI